jgi:hypothetical protein
MTQPTTGANLGFENKLWNAADRLRGPMDAAEYKHGVLGLIFLKYISDALNLVPRSAWNARPDAPASFFSALPAGSGCVSV